MFKATLFLFLLFYLGTEAQQLDSTNLPIIIINTHGQQISDEPKIMADMGIIWNGANMNHINDPSNHYNGKVGIETRGQTSQSFFPMKSYAFETWDSLGNEKNTSLFGLPSESDWVLYAPYNEKTLTHNFLAYTLFREMGHWAPNCRYVEIILNGQYMGIYVFMEKIKRDAGRVPIVSLDSADNSGAAVTGGYIFSIDKEADGWYSNYPAGTTPIQFSYVYPKISDITPQQQNYIEAFTDSFENALHSSTFQDVTTGWRKYADENSFIDYFLMNELSRNVDGYRISTYFHKNRSGKIKAGPVWDYDIAFRNANYCDGSDTAGWAYLFNNICGFDPHLVPEWWSTFLTDTIFANHLYCRWNDLRTSLLDTTNIFHLIDSIATLTADVRVRHFQKWPVLGIYVWPNPMPVATTYEGEIQSMKTWLIARLNWLDHNILPAGPCAVPPPAIDSNAVTVIHVFPNPVLENIQLNIESEKFQELRLKVIDVLGRPVFFTTLLLAEGSNPVQLESSSWATGFYFLEFSLETGEKVVKTVVKK